MDNLGSPNKHVTLLFYGRQLTKTQILPVERPEGKSPEGAELIIHPVSGEEILWR